MNRSTRGNLPRQVRGFTLLEMLVVLVIIGMLAGLVGPKLFTKVDSSKQQTAQTQVKMFKGSLETLRLDINRFPTADEGLAILNTAPTEERRRRAGVAHTSTTNCLWIPGAIPTSTASPVRTANPSPSIPWVPMASVAETALMRT